VAGARCRTGTLIRRVQEAFLAVAVCLLGETRVRPGKICGNRTAASRRSQRSFCAGAGRLGDSSGRIPGPGAYVALARAATTMLWMWGRASGRARSWPACAVQVSESPAARPARSAVPPGHRLPAAPAAGSRRGAARPAPSGGHRWGRTCPCRGAACAGLLALDYRQAGRGQRPGPAPHRTRGCPRPRPPPGARAPPRQWRPAAARTRRRRCQHGHAASCLLLGSGPTSAPAWAESPGGASVTGHASCGQASGQASTVGRAGPATRGQVRRKARTSGQIRSESPGPPGLILAAVHPEPP
jgi:hypothetical protein